MNITKKIIYLLAFAAFISCDEMLDLEPNQSISEEAAFTSAKNVNTALVGGYDLLSQGNLAGGYWGIISDILGNNGDVEFAGTFTTLREIDRKQITTQNGQVAGTWLAAYRVITQANAIIDAVENGNIPNVNPLAAHEARFLRAVAHFETVRLYAKAYNDGDPTQNPGIPLLTAPIRDAKDPAQTQLPRNTVQQVYDQVVADLIAARDNLGNITVLGFPGSQRAYAANTYVASAYLARVYLTMGRYAEAATEAQRVIDSGFYALTTVDALWPSTDATIEDVFSTPVNSQDGANSFSTFWSFFSRGDMFFTDQHAARYEEGDVRQFAINEFYETIKWDDVVEGDVKVIRLAEMYLIHAEAIVRSGAADLTPALTSINTIRTRAGLTDLTAVTLDDVLKEWLVEVAFEGHLFHIVKRFQLSVEGSTGSFPWNNANLILPIPQRERDVNPNLVQNEGYLDS